MKRRAWAVLLGQMYGKSPDYSVGASPNTRPECSRIAWNWMSGARSCATLRSELYCTRKAGAPTMS
jgi:hypothetical protein